MATNLSDLYKYVMPQLPRCPEPLVLEIVRDIAIDFCHETQLWQVDLDSQNIVQDEDTYELDGEQPSNTEIDAVVKVEVDDNEQNPETQYTVSKDLEVVFETAPGQDITAGLDVRVALKPSLSATTVDTQLFKDWYRTWAFGVMGTLMVMPGKAWSNPALGTEYLAKYRDGVIKGAVENTRGKWNKPLRARPPHRFA